MIQCERLCIVFCQCGTFTLCYMNGSVKEPNKLYNYETEKITRKASVAAKKPAIISTSSVLPPEIVMHDTVNVILLTSTYICIMHIPFVENL